MDKAATRVVIGVVPAVLLRSSVASKPSRKRSRSCWMPCDGRVVLLRTRLRPRSPAISRACRLNSWRIPEQRQRHLSRTQVRGTRERGRDDVDAEIYEMTIILGRTCAW